MATKKKKKKIKKNLNHQQNQRRKVDTRENHCVHNKRFRRNILIGVIALLVVAFIINTAPGYRKNKYADITNLVITNENITDKLIYKIYINDKDTIYIAKDDLNNLFDKTIYYDEIDNTVIITSDSSIASMKIGEKALTINGANIQTIDTIMYIENIMYIPISELENVYNISVKYMKDSNIVVIDDLSKGIETAETSDNTKLKFRPRGLSKTLKNISKNERVYVFETTRKGWRLIRTEDGVIGYVKAKDLTNEYIVRQDMGNKKVTTKKVKANLQSENIQEIDGQEIIIKDLFTLSNDEVTLKVSTTAEENEKLNIWANISSSKELNLKKYEDRTKLIDSIVKMVYKYKIKGINININEETEGIERFVIELAPRLKEMGIITNIIANGNLDEEKYKGIVQYIITKE